MSRYPIVSALAYPCVLCRVGWHHRLNRRARRGRLDLYQLGPLLHREAKFAETQLTLLSEHKLRRCRRRQHASVQSRLQQLWDDYSKGAITTSKLLRACSHLNGPIVRDGDADQDD